MKMSRLAIVTDSTADLPDALQRHHLITVVPIGVRIDENENVTRTYAPAPEQFTAVFSELAADFEGILAVLGSAKLGGMVASAEAARASIEGSVPIEIVDSRSATMGLGWQAVRAADLAAEGMSLPELADTIRGETDRYEVVFFVDTLEHLRRGGRLGRAATLIGGALDLKPLLRIDEGQVVEQGTPAQIFDAPQHQRTRRFLSHLHG